MSIIRGSTVLGMSVFSLCVCMCVYRTTVVGMSWRLQTLSCIPGISSLHTSNHLPSLTEWYITVFLPLSRTHTSGKQLLYNGMCQTRKAKAKKNKSAPRTIYFSKEKNGAGPYVRFEPTTLCSLGECSTN